LLEENVRHVDVEVLASVNESLLYALPLVESVIDGSEFHEVGPSPYNVEDFHGFSAW
jgi:hypothetical protein